MNSHLQSKNKRISKGQLNIGIRDVSLNSVDYLMLKLIRSFFIIIRLMRQTSSIAFQHAHEHNNCV